MAERKILIIFCYYVLLVVIALIAFTASTRTAVQFAAAVADYWRCELTGVDPENPCDELNFHLAEGLKIELFFFVLSGKGSSLVQHFLSILCTL